MVLESESDVVLPPPEAASAVILPLDPSRLTISLPPGFLFRPTDEQLLFYYLKGRVMNLDFTDAIAEVNIYKYEPWDLRALSKLKSSEEWYFFTKKHYWGPESKRRTPKGSWIARPTAGHKYKNNVLADKSSDFKGAKKPFDFYVTRDSKEDMTGWSMEEYYFENRFDYFALCKVFKTKKEIIPVMVEQTTTQVNVEEEEELRRDYTLADTSSSSSDDDAATALLLIPQAQTE